MSSHDIVTDILIKRGLTTKQARDAFLNPSYNAKHDPFLLPDMKPAVERLVRARDKQERITIYGDYDIDGLTATAILIDALSSFGFKHVSAFIPNRFVEGYGLTVEAIEKIAATGANLIITVDCGSLSHEPITWANELGMEVIVTDHHNVAEVQPPAVAVINPKRLLKDYPDLYKNYLLTDFDKVSSAVVSSSRDKSSSESLQPAELAKAQTSSSGQDSVDDLSGLSKTSLETFSQSSQLYPFLDLPGVGVAFKLVQALQTKLDGLEDGQEKWLLDLVALGTVCDVVTLQDENRANVYWGLKVLAKTRRPGLKALMAVSRVEPDKVNARSLGFALGPRMNAAGRLETAQIALDMLTADDSMKALEKAQQLDDLNQARRAEQDVIYKEALNQAEKYRDDAVLVLSAPGWNHGIIGIVAAKILEKFKKPTYVLQELGDESKGSARSYGDFSAADAIRASDDIITKGGGHKLAAGVTLPTKNIDAFRKRVNEYYHQQKLSLSRQQATLLPEADIDSAVHEVSEEIVKNIEAMEPFGNGNPQPVLRSNEVVVEVSRRMGSDAQHVKITVTKEDARLSLLAFNAPEHFFVEPGETVNVWYQPDINEWRGVRSVEGRLLHLELAD